MSESFGQVLKRLREKRRVSQSRLAQRAKCSHSYVSRLESNARMPSRDAVLDLADALTATATERAELLTAAGFLPADGPHLADPSLSRLHAILSSNRLSPQDDQQIRAVLAMAATFAERAA